MSATPTSGPSRPLRPSRPAATVRRGGRRTAAVPAAGAALVLALAGCSSTGGSGPADGSGTRYVEGSGAVTTVEQGHRTAAPDVSGATVDGGHLSLSDYPGKIIVLNVWGSWCDPCRAEAPNLAQVAKATASKGVQFVGINTRDVHTAQAVSFERDFKIGYPSLFDPDGRLLLEFPRGNLSPSGIPNTLILDRQHRIAVRLLKPLTAEELTKALDPIIAEK
jgi:thiol-disulfide isomerase/thioredoxin